MISPDVTGTVGRTPLVELGRLAAGVPGRVVAKLEMRNPCGSVKDRLGLALVEDAERRGLVKPGMTLVESTGGNTGIGLALAAAVRGYRLILTMPESMSTERVALLRHFGAEVVLTPGILMGEAVAAARRISSETPDAVLLDQFANPANPEVHRRTTAPEIWDGTGGAVDVFVSAVGTGGTITGVGGSLRVSLPALPYTPHSFSPPAPKRRANHRRAACRHRRAVRDHCADDRAAQLRPGGCRRHGQRYHQFWRMINWQLLPRGYRANQHWFTPAPNE